MNTRTSTEAVPASASFIKAAEVWLPSADGQLLEFGSGTFGPARRFATITKAMCFGRGEGLPGRAWDEGRPVLLNNLDDPYFRRGSAARAAGLTCALALPFFQRDKLTAVLVIFCGHGTAVAAMELWHNDVHIATDMTLVAGAYGPHGAAFETISRETTLPRGVGLPGQAWRRGAAVFVDDLCAKQHHFVRAEQVVAVGLKRGLAIPMYSRRASDRHVLTFLMGAQSPLVKRIERWLPNDARTVLNCVDAYSEELGAAVLTDEVPLSLPLSAAGSVAAALNRAAPVINIHPAKDAGAPGVTAGMIDASALLAIPVVWDGEVVEVVVLYL